MNLAFRISQSLSCFNARMLQRPSDSYIRLLAFVFKHDTLTLSVPQSVPSIPINLLSEYTCSTVASLIDTAPVLPYYKLFLFKSLFLY